MLCRNNKESIFRLHRYSESVILSYRMSERREIVKRKRKNDVSMLPELLILLFFSKHCFTMHNYY